MMKSFLFAASMVQRYGLGADWLVRRTKASKAFASVGSLPRPNDPFGPVVVDTLQDIAGGNCFSHC